MGISENPEPGNLSDALRECELRLQSVLDLSSDAYWEQDENYCFTLVTGGQLERLGLDVNTYLGKARWDGSAVPVNEVEGWDAHKAVLHARQPFRDFTYKRPSAQGGTRYISASGQPMFDAGGRFKGYRGIARDITERMRAVQLQSLEHTVAHRIAEARSASDAMTAAIRAICETEHWDCGRYFRPGDKPGELRLGEAWGEPEPAIQEFIERSRALVYEAGIGLTGKVWQSGEPLWVADTAKDARATRAAFSNDSGIRGGFVFPVIAEGAPIGVLAFNSRELREPDVQLMQAINVIGSQIGQFVRRKQSEEELRRFRAAIDASADLIFLVDPQRMRYIDVNDAACRALGYTREELLAMGPLDIFSKSREELVQVYARLFADTPVALNYEGVYRRKDGSRLVVEAFPRAMRPDGGHSGLAANGRAPGRGGGECAVGGWS